MPFDVKNGFLQQKTLKSRLDGADDVIAHDAILFDALGNAITTAARGSERALTVQVVDAAGNQVINFGAAAASGGSVPFRLTSAASNNATSVKASPGQVYGIQVYNVSTAIAYLKLYNKASVPAPATDNALLAQVYPIPAGGGLALEFPEGMEFTTGIAFAIVAGGGDTDNTSIAAGDVFLNMQTK